LNYLKLFTIIGSSLLAHVFSSREGKVPVERSNVNKITDVYDDGARAKCLSREGKSR